ncbi:hypothetical protein GCM10025734_25990 [Kitasatospora paranensis]
MHELPQQLANGLILGSLYGLIAIGYTMVYGIVQLINFAHGEIFMTGGFGALTTYTVLPSGTGIWLALPLMLLGGVLVSVIVAVGAERFAYRPLRGAPKLAPLITAIGLSLALQQVVEQFYPGAKSGRSFPSCPAAPSTSAASPSSPPTSSSSLPPRCAWAPSPPSSARPAPAAACRPPRRTRTPPS